MHISLKINFSNIVIILALSAVLTGCEQNLLCGDSQTKGIIAENVSFGGYLNDFPDSAFIITTQDELNTLYEHEASPDLHKPQIDFVGYTLLGQYAEAGGCSAQFDREVIRDETNTQYIYTVSIKQCGMCDMLVYNMNWVLVPKLPDAWTVKFVVILN